MLEDDKKDNEFSLELVSFLESEAIKTSRLPVPKELKRKEVVKNFQHAFELIGGVPRLAIWGNDHPGEFYKLYARLIPPAVQEVSGEVRLIHVLPRTLLDGEVTEAEVVDERTISAPQS